MSVITPQLLHTALTIGVPVLFLALGIVVLRQRREIRLRGAAEGALVASRARLAKIIELVPAAVISIGADHRIRSFSAGAESAFGYAAADVIGRKLDILLPDCFRADHDAHIDRFAASGDVNRTMKLRGEVSGLRRDGTEFPAEASIARLGDGDETEFIVMLRDVSEREEWEAQLRQAQKMEVVGQLTGGVAHDFNNLLTIMLGNMQLVERRLEGDAEARKLLSTAIRAAQRGGDLTHRLLAFARRQPLAPSRVDLNALVDDTVELIARTIGENISVTVSRFEELWPAHVDPSQVQSALMNLVINAGLAMPDGGELLISTGNTYLDRAAADAMEGVNAGDYVSLSVHDTGAGMTPEVAGRAFEPFFTTREVGEGSGLGLSMVFGFAKQSGGHASIESEVGKGCTVMILLPRASAGYLSGRVREVAADGDGCETVLVVEDNADVREIAVNHLVARGYRVVEAHDAPQALGLLQNDRGVDVLFTDIMLPNGMSGVELAGAARRFRPGLKVLFTSGNAKVRIDHDDQVGEASAFLAKPYAGEDLADRMRNLVSGRSLEKGATP